MLGMNKFIFAAIHGRTGSAHTSVRGGYEFGRIEAIVLMLLLGLMFINAVAAPTPVRKLKAIQTIALPGGGVRVDLQLNRVPMKPLSFSVDRPAMIILDLPDTRLVKPIRRSNINIGDLAAVETAAADGRTRVVLRLVAMSPYKTRIAGNHVYVTIGSVAKVTLRARNVATKTFGPVSGQHVVNSRVSTVTSLRFHRTQSGAGRVLIGLSSPSVSGNVNQEGNRVVVSFPGVTLPKRLQERLKVSDFATPVDTITARQTPVGAEIVVKGKGPFEQLAFQTNKTFAVELNPVNKQRLAIEGKQRYTGKRLTLNFQKIPVRAILQILAKFTGKNIVVSGSVNGNITLRLHNVPWDEALAIILRSQGLSMKKIGNVLMIAPAAEFARQEQQQLRAQSQMRKLAPLQTAYIQINYAKAGNLAKLIKSQKSTLLSSRGTVTVDPRTNTLIVHDTAAHIGQVGKLVHVLDIPVRQVLIESRIVIVQNNFERDLGVRFGVSGLHQGPNSVISVDGSALGNNNMLASLTNPTGTGIGTGGSSPGKGTYTYPQLNNRLNVNIPVTNPAGQFAVAILSGNFLVDLELSALQAEGKGEVVSSPRVITANQQKATIEQGVEIPYQNSTSSGATSVQFKKAVLSLQVTPQITPDNRILMNIEVHNDTVGKYVPTTNGGQVPSINTRTVTTQVLVDNGDTVVLGGIYQTTRNKTTNKVPLLGDIPLLGVLFRNTKVVNDKVELLVFVTPKILAANLSQ